MLHACAAICIAIQFGGCKASPPNRVESKEMTAAKQHIFVRGKSPKNPLRDSAATPSDGKESFSHYCAARHGLGEQNTRVPFVSRIVVYLRHLPPAGSLGEPEMYSH